MKIEGARSGRSRCLFMSFALSLAAMTSGCAPAMQQSPTGSTSPSWTFENPNAEKAAQAKGQPSSPVTTSSLEALRSGESTATAPSAPLKDIYFGFDSADLSADARAMLKSNADWLKNNPAARVQVEGHCDARGTAEYNLALGAKRAQAATDFLVTLGIPKDRLSTISYGQEIPVCNESTEECWAKNRRARFVIVTGKPAS